MQIFSSAAIAHIIWAFTNFLIIGNFVALKLAIPFQEMVSEMVKLLKEEDFYAWVGMDDHLNIVRFCAEWSGPCHIMAPIYHDLSLVYQNLASFYEIDADKSPQLRLKLGVTEIPTILFYSKGDLIDFTTGLISRDILIEKLEKAMKY